MVSARGDLLVWRCTAAMNESSTAIGIAVASMFQPHFFSAHVVGTYFWLMYGLVSRADEELRATQPQRSRILRIEKQRVRVEFNGLFQMLVLHHHLIIVLAVAH